MLLSTYLRLSRHKSETALASLIDFLRYQRATSQSNPHRDHLSILICHDARLLYVETDEVITMKRRNISPMLWQDSMLSNILTGWKTLITLIFIKKQH